MPNINQIIAGFFNRENYTLRNFTAFLIILLPIQYGPILGTSPINPLKVVFMAIAGIVWLVHFVPNKAFFFGSIYFAWIFFVAAGLYPASFRASTLLYTVLFLVTFFCIYTALWNYHVFDLEFFTKLIKCFILTIIVFLLFQQLCLILGYRRIPLLNLYSYLNRGIGANSLFFEPSHFGRVLCVLYYAILKCTEYSQGYKVPLTQIFSDDLKWITIGFIWCILTMGSGTAFLAAGITSLYFMRGWGFLSAIPIFVVIFFILESSGNESFERARVASIATMTGDAEMVREVDGSASTRIAPMLNTLNADFTSTDFWIGKGTDSTNWWDFAMGRGYIGHINDYGLISYILELCIIFGCCIRFRSLGTLYFLTGTGGGITNISYAWGNLLIFCCVTYFYYQSQIHEDENLRYSTCI